MKSSAERTNGVTRPDKSGQISIISERKLKANRENAKSSSGPRTIRGKSYSRQNALKHGVLALKLKELRLKGEDPHLFSRLHSRFRDELQPVGAIEELEVEHIVKYWWRLSRLWAYENAQIRLGQDHFEKLEMELSWLDPIRRFHPRIRSDISRIREAQEKVRSTGKVSQEVRKDIRFVVGPFELKAEKSAKKHLLEIAEQIAEKRGIPLEEAEQLLRCDPRAQPEYECFVVLTALTLSFLKITAGGDKPDEICSAEMSRELIPGGGALDNIIRYEAAIERSLTRAYDRLERLQRRRLGEPLLPAARSQMTQ